MPVGVEQRRAAHLLQPIHFACRQFQVRSRKVFGELRVGAGTDDQRGDAGPGQQPGECDLRGSRVPLLRDRDQFVDDPPQRFLIDIGRLRPALLATGAFGIGIIARELARQQTCCER